MQILEDFDVSQVKVAHNLQEYEAERKQATKGAKAETIVLPDNDSNEHKSEDPA